MIENIRDIPRILFRLPAERYRVAHRHIQNSPIYKREPLRGFTQKVPIGSLQNNQVKPKTRQCSTHSEGNTNDWFTICIKTVVIWTNSIVRSERTIMTMLNQAAVEALCSATYLENYLDTMDNLPDDLQRVVTQMRELDIQCRDILADIDVHQETYSNEPDGSPAKRKAMISMQRALIKCQEIGDEKLMLLACIMDHIENRARQLEQDRENLDPNSGRDQDKEERELIIQASKQIKQQPQEDKPEKVPVKRQRRQKTNNDSISREDIRDEKDKGPKKKKKRKTKKEQTPTSPIDPPIDPDEPTYCLCNQVSYGEMIGCDNDICVIEWFHFNCVGLVNKPKGKWFCPNCRGETSKVMRRFDKT